MKTTHQLILAALLLAACPKPTPDGGIGQRIVHCGSEAVQNCAPGALPAVNGCLTGTGDVTACVLSLIQPAGCVTYEVVACLVRHEGEAATAAYSANHSDTRDAWRSARAREFLENTKPEFH
jgi:hypothetical protein